MFDRITTFSFPTRIVFGVGATRQLPACLKESGVRQPLLVTDPGLRAAPPFKAVESALQDGGVQYEVFDGVHPNPIEEDVVQAALLQALEAWKIHGVPEDPAAWLYRVARNKALDLIRHQRRPATTRPNGGLSFPSCDRDSERDYQNAFWLTMIAMEY